MISCNDWVALVTRIRQNLTEGMARDSHVSSQLMKNTNLTPVTFYKSINGGTQPSSAGDVSLAFVL